MMFRGYIHRNKLTTWKYVCGSAFFRRTTSASAYQGKITTVNVKNLVQYFGMSTFSNPELKSAFERLKEKGEYKSESEGYVSENSIRNYMNEFNPQLPEGEREMITQSMIYELCNDTKTITQKWSTNMLLSNTSFFDVDKLPNFPVDQSRKVDYDIFSSKLRVIGESIDARVWPVALCNACKWTISWHGCVND